MPRNLVGHAEPTGLSREIVVRQLVYVGHASTKRGGEACVDCVERLYESFFAVLEEVGDVRHTERVQDRAVVDVELFEARVSVEVHRGADHDRPSLVFQKRKFSVSVRHDNRGITKRLANGGYVFGLPGGKASIRQKHQRAKGALFGQKRDVVGVAYAGRPRGNHEVGWSNLCEHSLDQVQKAKLPFREPHDTDPGRKLPDCALGAFGRRENGTRGRVVKTNGRRGVAKKRLLSLFRCHTRNLPRNKANFQ